jgi:hypothetical protein
MAYFQTEKAQIGQILEGLAKEGIGICILWQLGLLYGQTVYFVAIWYILWLFVIFFQFWYIVPIEIWQHCSEESKEQNLK